MKIATYENTVQRGAIQALKRDDMVEDLSKRISSAQRIVTAPVSVRSSSEYNEEQTSEANSAEGIEKGFKSTAGAIKDATASEIKRTAKHASKRPKTASAANPVRTASRTVSAGKTTAKTAVTAGKTAAKITGATVRTAAKTAEATVKTTASVGAGAATAGVSAAAQAAAEATKKVTVGAVQKVQESAKAAVHNVPEQAAEMAKSSSVAQEASAAFAEQAQPKGWTKFAFFVVGVAGFFILLFGGLVAGSQAAACGRAVNLNARVESYRASVQHWASEYGIPEYTEVLLALCMAETGILENPGDPFACSESGYAVKQPNGITDPEYSIEIGVYCFSLKIKKAKCVSPADRNNLFKALQAYNMGDGFIDFCDAYYGGVWSVECAQAFSDLMGNGGVYGNPNYIEQFLRCYEFGTVESAFSGVLNASGLCWPLGDVGQDSITQHFGGMYSGEPHKGMDVGVPEGTPIYAAADGQVTAANATDPWGYSWGYYVKIKHSDVHDTLYAHMSRVAVAEGQYVKQGELIGYVGSTGNSSGPHLHFELYLNGTRVDPEPYIGTDALQKYLITKQ